MLKVKPARHRFGIGQLVLMMSELKMDNTMTNCSIAPRLLVYFIAPSQNEGIDLTPGEKH